MFILLADMLFPLDTVNYSLYCTSKSLWSCLHRNRSLNLTSSPPHFATITFWKRCVLMIRWLMMILPTVSEARHFCSLTLYSKLWRDNSSVKDNLFSLHRQSFFWVLNLLGKQAKVSVTQSDLAWVTAYIH